MFNFNNIIEFSHLYCVEICGFIVPTNVLASLQPIIFTVLHRPKKEINLMALVASFYALIIILHVGSWFIVGVVRIQTFILLGFATCCLITNIWAVTHNSSMRETIKFLQKLIVKLIKSITIHSQDMLPETK
ncbi:MAG: hypothetical protein O4861_21445 [Trichodesmium sp. St16_bin4-tuft]|nr:hypothetical protein [Trichodesmium sp. St5_bin8]MDE5092534.1 hypothetical protein [Trichodesmium sp. St18_bin3_1_1]MDE5100755.1 hypothetical protein [Trichodesmium sp. St16_bin4-tuft]MDE5101600.1 hypothetical protein [Trichodesmium sp. St19_bin2]